MKRLKTFFARRGAVPAACYILAVAVWLVLSLAHAGSDALAKAQGRMTEQIIPVQSWQLVGLEPAEEQATAESALTLTTTNAFVLADNYSLLTVDGKTVTSRTPARLVNLTAADGDFAGRTRARQCQPTTSERRYNGKGND